MRNEERDVKCKVYTESEREEGENREDETELGCLRGNVQGSIRTSAVPPAKRRLLMKLFFPIWENQDGAGASSPSISLTARM